MTSKSQPPEATSTSSAGIDGEIDAALEALRVSVSRLLRPIQTTRVVDEGAFAALHDANVIRLADSHAFATD